MTEDEINKLDMTLEPVFEGSAPKLLQPGDMAPDFEFELTLGHRTTLSDVVKKGPALLNFIKGTWCPFCQTHLRNLRRWQDGLTEKTKKSVSILVISNEAIPLLREWARLNEVNYLLGGIERGKEVFRQYGVDIESHGFPRPATFLIESGLVVRFSYAGPRNEQLETAVNSKLTPL